MIRLDLRSSEKLPGRPAGIVPFIGLLFKSPLRLALPWTHARNRRAPADVAKHNYSSGPAGAKSVAVLARARSSGQSRTNGARSLRKRGEKMDRQACFFRATRAYRPGCRDRWHRAPSRATTSRCRIFFRRKSNPSRRARSISPDAFFLTQFPRAADPHRSGETNRAGQVSPLQPVSAFRIIGR